MLGYKATRLEGMKSTSPFRCLLVKLNCTYISILTTEKRIPAAVKIGQLGRDIHSAAPCHVQQYLLS